MTEQEQSLSDDRMRAEIAALIAETSKINTEARWHPSIVVATVVAGVAAPSTPLA